MTVAVIEQAIVARLQDKCGDLVDRVYTAGEVSQLEEQLQLTPSITVIYNGYRPSGDIAGGVIQGVAFEFLVVVAVKNARAAHRSIGVKDDASPILDACIEALLNFRPMQGGSILRLGDAPGVSFSEAGFAYYPLAFEITRTYRGN
jgi:phage gp37-like protein